MNIFLLRLVPLCIIYSWKLLRKVKWQIPGEPLAARYNWCQDPVPGSGPAVETHCSACYPTTITKNLGVQFCGVIPVTSNSVHTPRYWISVIDWLAMVVTMTWTCFSFYRQVGDNKPSPLQIIEIFACYPVWSKLITDVHFQYLFSHLHLSRRRRRTEINHGVNLK